MSTPSSKTATPPTEPSRPFAPLAPSTTNNAQIPSPSTHSILTGKQWVIPPRPKPGRKPAVDTPPTKRKAQNRAAQRAFRERRAAKVGELEEQMKAMEEEDQQEQEELRGQIRELENSVESYDQLLGTWGEKMKQMETQLKEERRMREGMQRDLERLSGVQIGVATDAVPLRPRMGSRKETAVTVPSIHEYLPTFDSDDMSNVPLGCGGCTKSTRCQCIEDALSLNPTLDASQKRPHSPSDPRAAKHLRQGPSGADAKPDDANDLEIDFTTSKPPTLPSQPPRSPPLISQITPIDPCGFCADGTACLCAEIAAEDAKGRHDTHAHPSFQSQASSDSFNGMKSPATYPSSSVPMNFTFSRSSSGKNTTGTAGSSPCANGPGTCAQCLSDPNSTLFCKSLASTRNAQAQVQRDAAPNLSTTLSASNPSALGTTNGPSTQSHPPASVTLTCAEAFTTLSRHPAFDRASFELGSWLPQLTTVPKGIEGKTAFEIEAASVLGVLKLFDNKYGETE